ncbi:hypothetical protein ABZ543_08025, partial [Streptomyces roseifaciens]
MADEEEFGVGRLRIVLDDAHAVADARDLGQRIERALDRSTRGIGDQIRRNIQRGLRNTTVSVRVTPDLRRFEAELRAGVRGLDSVAVRVTPDLGRFHAALRAGVRG